MASLVGRQAERGFDPLLRAGSSSLHPASTDEGDQSGNESASSFLLDNSFEMMKPQSIQNALAQNSRVISMIVADKSMKPEEKRQFIDMLYAQRITMAKRGNDILKELDKVS